MTIAANGSDETGTGTDSNPYLTINKCLAEGADKIMVRSGKYYQTIDFNNTLFDDITIVSRHPTGKAVFLHPDSLVTSSEHKLSGYTKIYYAEYATSFRDDINLYQEDVPDTNTRIADNERNPYERGQVCRCLDTKIVRCAATTLNAALSEIEASNNYLYFHDTDNNIIYFSRPHAVTATYPIMRSVHAATFINNQFRGRTLKCYGIEVKYMRFNVNNMVAFLYDCKAANVFGTGGFIYDWAYAYFERCEASGIYYAGSAGDGFNAHGQTDGEPFSKQTCGLLVDCWAHDCMDDGFSDHERCESEVYGGLFEYNGKGGITPAYGSHCSCYNVISRNNKNGFWYLGEATQAEGGKYGQIMCIACLAANNHDNNNGAGFAVTANGNRAILIDCRSIGNDVGYLCDSVSIMKTIDCRAADNTTVKTGTITIQNTNILE